MLTWGIYFSPGLITTAFYREFGTWVRESKVAVGISSCAGQSNDKRKGEEDKSELHLANGRWKKKHPSQWKRVFYIFLDGTGRYGVHPHTRFDARGLPLHNCFLSFVTTFWRSRYLIQLQVASCKSYPSTLCSVCVWPPQKKTKLWPFQAGWR